MTHPKGFQQTRRKLGHEQGTTGVAGVLVERIELTHAQMFPLAVVPAPAAKSISLWQSVGSLSSMSQRIGRHRYEPRLDYLSRQCLKEWTYSTLRSVIRHSRSLLLNWVLFLFVLESCRWRFVCPCEIEFLCLTASHRLSGDSLARLPLLFMLAFQWQEEEIRALVEHESTHGHTWFAHWLYCIAAHIVSQLSVALKKSTPDRRHSQSLTLDFRTQTANENRIRTLLSDRKRKKELEMLIYELESHPRWPFG